MVNCADYEIFDNNGGRLLKNAADYDKIDKLILRTRAKGDYIVIDDNGRKKKLKEYFINEKIKNKAAPHNCSESIQREIFCRDKV